MSKYNISTTEVSATLKATSKAAEGFEKDLQPMSGHVSAAAGACGNSGAIVPALNGLFEHEKTALNSMSTHIKACLTGAAAATTAYVEGDLEMMQTYQKNAAQGKVSKIPH
ncbi:DUF6507 family protein [Microlunatus sp. Gsoil 973]|uniref:DUF6507 family protein n=1 Tax=Microlunatus sp. Gsoil 973 TaxID=2672569 RepID=UPI0012B445FC|nr:DUF6507 family protein [Microlunatus sp. Gsoil 973]QGN34627.1 hypothetical protein GJV80_19355 [Microlunatus sp. Gsoil 973]